MDFTQLVEQFGGAGALLVAVLILVNQLVDKFGNASAPSHADLDERSKLSMMECEQRLKDHTRNLFNELKKETAPMAEQVKWLVDIHDRRDEDGLPVWYNKRELERGLKEVVEVGKETNLHIKDLVDEMRAERSKNHGENK